MTRTRTLLAALCAVLTVSGGLAATSFAADLPTAVPDLTPTPSAPAVALPAPGPVHAADPGPAQPATARLHPAKLRHARRVAIRVISRTRRVARHLHIRLPKTRTVYRTQSVAYLRYATRHWEHRLHHLSRLWHKARRGIRASHRAAREVGVPYVWGGQSPGHGFDCSGLVRWAYSGVGISLPRTTYGMIHSGHRVSRHSLRPGDLVFAYGDSHVGMYVGHGVVIDAPRPGRDVRRSPMRYWPLTEARRVV
ncbi:MAG: C40 family peptidase [Gaiellales bacterium]